MKESRASNITWGLIFVTAGVIFLGNELHFWNVDLFFQGWWTLFIVIPSIVGLFKHGARTSSFLGIVIGILLFMAAQDIIDWSVVLQAFLPILLVIIGLSLIFKPKCCGEKKVERKDDKGIQSYTAIFGGTEEKFGAKKFEGANCTAIFGGVDLDLRQAKIKDDILIDCTSIFGGIDIYVPEKVNVKTSGVPVFGGTECKIGSTDEKNPTIYINYTCIFGGIEIK